MGWRGSLAEVMRQEKTMPNNRIEHDEVWRADAPHLAAHA